MSGRSPNELVVFAGVAPGDTRAVIAGAVDEAVWEVMPEDEWQELRRKVIDASGMDTGDYEWRDVRLQVDADALVDAVTPRTLQAEVKESSS